MTPSVSILMFLMSLMMLRGAPGVYASPQKATQQQLLADVGAYLREYERTFSAVVAREAYKMTVSAVPQGLNVQALGTTERRLRADVMILDLGPGQWVQYRDVYELDGRPVRDHDNRLEAMLRYPTHDFLATARRIADESAAFNLGIPRTFNVPTMALNYLESSLQSRSTFVVRGESSVEGTRAILIEFREIARPGLITSSSGEVRTSGRVWIAPGTGAVLRTELQCRLAQGPHWVEGRVLVSYRRESSSDLLVPVSMEEEYSRDTGETDTGHADYDQFRLFTVDTRLFRTAR